MRFSIIQPILTTAAVVCSLSAVIQPVSVSAEDSGLQLSECYVYDEAGVLTSEEAIELDELVYETAVDLQMNICVRLGANKLSSESDAREYAVADYLDRFGDEKETDGCRNQFPSVRTCSDSGFAYRYYSEPEFYRICTNRGFGSYNCCKTKRSNHFIRC